MFKIVGTTVSYEQLKDGIHAGSGKGTIDGQNLQYTYVDDRTHDTGACTGLLSNDGTKIDGTCGNNSGRWGFKVTR
ncbi:hypothetical protein GCM10007874_23010 [Labrys miyagiensis]|uniref:Uncharacterized protein n=1 Tax=Labrys miyagiensis TaxID=346912 RepID=A0ABQ6CGC5_9HYPH|nr:hypothetical protein GCM10007874_23010 [Labrys miyagiensis]